MSRIFAHSTLALVSLIGVAVSTASNATTSHRSLEETVAQPRTLRGASAFGVAEARQLFITGQVIPAGFGQPVGYSQLNAALRAEYRLDAEPDYVFASGYLYAIDHATKTVRRVIPVDLAR